MRAYTKDGITLTVPDGLIYSGDRNVCKITNASSSSIMTFYLNDIVDNRDIYQNECEIDISYYLNSLFETNKTTNFNTFATPIVCLIEVGSTTFTFSFGVIFGKQNILNKGYKYDFLTRTITSDAPYIYSYALFEANHVYISTNAVDWTDLGLKQRGIYSIDLSSFTSTGAYIRIGDGTSTFDYTFDFTFQSGLNNVIIFEPACYKNPYVLRWLDSLGIWQTQTFSKVGENLSNETTLLNLNESSFSGIVGAYKNSELSIDLILENLDLNNQKRIQGLINSSFVHIYIENEWIPCAVTNNGLPIRTKEDYQDIVITCKLQNV